MATSNTHPQLLLLSLLECLPSCRVCLVLKVVDQIVWHGHLVSALLSPLFRLWINHLSVFEVKVKEALPGLKGVLTWLSWWWLDRSSALG